MTDGDTLSKDGQNYSLLDARKAIIADLAHSAKTFPFHVEGEVFHQIIELNSDRYVIVLVDPGWLNPAERVVTLSAQRPGTWHVTDRLTGVSLGNLSQPLEVSVPAGALRLIELTLR